MRIKNLVFILKSMKSSIYVLAGGNGFGKTTILKGLSKLGYYTIPEAADIAIKEAKSNGIENPWENFFWLETKIIEKQLENQSKIPENKEVFMDRSILDNIAFQNIELKRPLQYAVDNANSIKFDKVFLIEPITNWNKDCSSHTTYEFALKVHKEIEAVYRNYGYNPIKVPELTEKKRLRYILDRL